MTEQNNYIDKFNRRRNFFQKYFPIKIGRQRVDVKSEDILKNSCPVCGYLTLDERDCFEICEICFWEDDGIDDFEEYKESGPNHMTLREGRVIFQEAKGKLIAVNNSSNDLLNELKDKFLALDSLIEQDIIDRTEILRRLTKIVDLLTKNKIHGLQTLFEK